MPRSYDTPQEPLAPDFLISYDKHDHRFSKSQGVWWAGDRPHPTNRQARAYAIELQRRHDALRGTLRPDA